MRHPRTLFAVRGILLPLVALAAALPARSADDYLKSVEDWRADRVARLTRADGWLTLVGRHLLRPGANTIGTAADNQIPLAAGPAHFGTITVAPGGIVTFAAAPGVYPLIDGLPAQQGEMRYQAGLRATRIQSGTVMLQVLARGSQLVLRVRDSESANRRGFLGLDYFPINPAWRIEAQWVPYDPPHQVPFTDVVGQTSPLPVPGKAVFTVGGQTYELEPIDEGAENPLFFVIADPTNGRETHGGGRFLYAAWPKDGKVVLDFNHMENPPCAFSAFTVCPLPPKGNTLPFAIDAGEKSYRGERR